ncbi:hypothetical protein QOT17_023513 [Balamuthia mandrillaris]
MIKALSRFRRHTTPAMDQHQHQHQQEQQGQHEAEAPPHQQRAAVRYATQLTYPPSHWAHGITVEARQADSLYRVGALWHRGEVPVVVALNPTDSRGYRLLCTVTDPEDVTRTFNKAPTAEQMAALGAALAFMAVPVFQELGLVAQTMVLGNNSHSMEKEGGEGEEEEEVMVVGQPHEPHLIHGHVVGRGNPRWEVVKGLPLGGPPPGSLFPLKSPHEGQKRGWTAEHAAAFRTRLQELIEKHAHLAASLYQLLHSPSSSSSSSTAAPSSSATIATSKDNNY